MKRKYEYEYIPCVGCGYCCMKVACGVAHNYFTFSFDTWGKGLRCPALYWDGKRYGCIMAMVSARVRRELHIGAGCTSSLNSWRGDVRKRE